MMNLGAWDAAARATEHAEMEAGRYARLLVTYDGQVGGHFHDMMRDWAMVAWANRLERSSIARDR